MKSFKALFGLLLCSLAVSATPHQILAPLNPVPHGAETTGRYIVVLKDTSVPADVLSELGLAESVAHVYETALKGFSGKFNEATLNLIRANPATKYIDHDLMYSAFDTQTSSGYNLAMVSEPSRLQYGQLVNYTYFAPPGQGTTVYVLDTGVYTQNVDFEGRAHQLYAYYGGGDRNGHGTHVAGVVAGRLFGVAKSSRILSIQVLGADGKGSTDAIVGGINIATGHCSGRCVINLSLGGPRQDALNQAATNAAAAGLSVLAAAGNDNIDACGVSPASAIGVITIAAVGHHYYRAPFSNFGRCVNFFAAGVDIISAGITSPSSINVQSGTSQATPAVAGLAAYYATRGIPTDYTSMLRIMQKYAKVNYVVDTKGSPNLLANNGYFDGFN